MYHCQPVLCEFMSCLYYYDEICSLHNKIRPRKWRFHSSMMLFQLPLLTIEGRFGQSSCDSSTPSNWSPLCQQTVFPVFVSLCLISPEEILLKFKKKSKKSGYLIDLAKNHQTNLPEVGTTPFLALSD